jgi:hypothetical protein
MTSLRLLALPLVLLALSTLPVSAETVGLGPGYACSGSQVFDAGSPARTQVSFRLTYNVTSRRFCLDRFCDALTAATPERVEYHCRSGRTFCEPGQITSTAGPFITREDFTFDRRTLAFTRTSSGSVGDPASRPFTSQASGSCRPLPGR